MKFMIGNLKIDEEDLKELLYNYPFTIVDFISKTKEGKGAICTIASILEAHK